MSLDPFKILREVIDWSSDRMYNVLILVRFHATATATICRHPAWCDGPAQNKRLNRFSQKLDNDSKKGARHKTNSRQVIAPLFCNVALIPRDHSFLDNVGEYEISARIQKESFFLLYNFLEVVPSWISTPICFDFHFPNVSIFGCFCLFL
mmetsp:Transcript_1241/g.2726  ORF Transcript_1241/g.2726 Transcript_1241/m.2726 type:complete len:150 (+) Transcript_1241:2178-2627(+)